MTTKKKTTSSNSTPRRPRKRINSWRREQAMEAGMLHGIDAYNDMMGYSTERPEED